MSLLGEVLRPRGPVQFELSEQRVEDGLLMRVAGELDVLTVPQLASRLDELIRSHAEDLVINLDAATFIDSVGLHALLNAQRRLARRGRNLSVVCAGGQVRRVIDMARLADALNLV